MASCVCTSTSFTCDTHLCSPLFPQTLLEKALAFGSHSAVPLSSSEESSSAKVLQSEEHTTLSQYVCPVLLIERVVGQCSQESVSMCDSTPLSLCNEALRHVDQGLLVTCIEMALDSFN